MRIVSLSGRARAGKDTSALILRNYLGHKEVNVCSFAAKLKKVCQDAFDLTDEQIDGKQKDDRLQQGRYFHPDYRMPYVITAFGLQEDYNCRGSEWARRKTKTFWSPRELLQYVGGFLRELDEDAIIKSLDLRADKINIITDLRVWREFDYIQRQGGHIPFVIRRRSALTMDDPTEEVANTRDYRLLSLGFYSIDNNASKRELELALIRNLGKAGIIR